MVNNLHIAILGCIELKLSTNNEVGLHTLSTASSNKMYTFKNLGDFCGVIIRSAAMAVLYLVTYSLHYKKSTWCLSLGCPEWPCPCIASLNPYFSVS